MAGLVALALAYVLSQFFRSFLPVLTPQLTSDLGADQGDLSLASGLWFMSFGIMQFVVGVGLDRYGPRRTASLIFGLGAGSGALVFATAQSGTGIVVGMTLIGIGCSPVLMSSLFIFAKRFDTSRFAFMTSSLVAFGNLGNVIGASPLANAAHHFGWRMTMGAIGVLSLLLALAILLLVRDPDKRHSQGGGIAGYITLLKMPVLWGILVMTLFCYATVAGIRGLWAGPFLADHYQADSLQIGQVTLWMALAMVAGSAIYGPLDRWFDSRKMVALTGNAIVLICLIFLATQPLAGLTQTTILFILIGVCGTSYGVLMAHGRAFLPSQLVGRGVTLLNFFSIFGAGIMQFATGRLANTQPDPGSASSYQWVFGLYAATLGIALLIYSTSREARPSEDERQ